MKIASIIFSIVFSTADRLGVSFYVDLRSWVVSAVHEGRESLRLVHLISESTLSRLSRSTIQWRSFEL